MRFPVSWTHVRRSLPDALVTAADWQRRAATLVGAVLIGLAALGFAWAGDRAQHLFLAMQAARPWTHLVVTPAMFVAIAALTLRFAPEIRGSGIPQVIAAARHPDDAGSGVLVSLKAAFAKVGLTIAALFGGAAVGREGPTVQLAAALMVQVHNWLRVPLSAGVLIAGGAAGVAAAFNTPLAGIAFAIEELAVAYEQRVAVLVMGAVMIAGLTAQGIAGQYVYFGELSSAVRIPTVLVAAPLAGIVGGVLGGLFSRALIALRGPGGRWSALLAKRPVLTALGCGVAVGAIGWATGGATAGTGYGPTETLLGGGGGAYWFGPAKFASALATSVSGIPGGIFAPSLAVGAGFGDLLTPLFAPDEAGLIVLMGMAGYFTGVVRAPLTAVIILSEATGTSHAILPLFATALIGDWVGAMVCRDRLYHRLAQGFAPPPPPVAFPRTAGS
ncbi:chloride channel protein [Tsuneonella sp. YG55]|uniref:Chloride channel protein n=1 Tax=Tsuneonella litorea TaxID=2976475 RepID=A0A9X2W3Z5_9SPHN|nr:chloride channel protein [Tsuneonella litorea]MCT2559809.1 chloride channel protein [Tsuneonella litorea]